MGIDIGRRELLLPQRDRWKRRSIGSRRTSASPSGLPAQIRGIHFRDLASNYDRLARLSERAGRPSEALDAYVEADRNFAGIIGKDPSQAAWQRDAAVVLENMGTLILQGRRSGPRHRGFPACLVPARGACGLSQNSQHLSNRDRTPDRPSGRAPSAEVEPNRGLGNPSAPESV